MSACRKLSLPIDAPEGKLVKLYRGYLEETGSEVAAAIFAIDAYRKSEAEPPAPKSGKESKLLTIKQVAAEFNVSTRTLYRLKPLHVKFGKAVRIRRADLENYLRQDLFG
jgi:excisionase family DNA binding protein